LIAVFALWVKRYLIIIPTLESPLLPIHDLRPEYVHYSPTWVEWTLTVAGVALFLLLFYIFSKIHPDHTGGQDGRGEGLLEIAKACI